ncbi:MAG: hypothetical protein ACYC9S_12615 [Leptospirales bacterium]
MSFKRLEVNLSDLTLSAIKKRAFSEGKSASEIARKMLEYGVDNPSASGEGASSKIDLDGIGETLLEAIRKARVEKIKEDETTREVMESLGLASESGSANGPGLSPEVVHYLVETSAKIDSVLRKISLHLSGGNFNEHQDRVKVAEGEAAEVLKKLNIGGDK